MFVKWELDQNGQIPFSRKNFSVLPPFPKLIREMSLFYNSIFSKSSFKLKKKKKIAWNLGFIKDATISLHETQL